MVLVDGRIVEMGGHDELLAEGGVYSRLCHMQSGLVKLEPEPATTIG